MAPTHQKDGKDSWRHRAFRAAVVVKMLDGTLEAALGIWLYFFGKANLPRLLYALFQHELREDPHDFIATHLLEFVRSLSVSTLSFIGIYLTIRGVTKAVLMIALSANQRWAYPVSLLILTTLVLYGVYRLILVFSFTIGCLLLIDIAVIGLIYAEYRTVKLARQQGSTRPPL
jgi:uncharacterized membrane protein